MRPACGDHEVGPRHRALDEVHPLLGTPHVRRVLARAEEAAADLSDRAVGGDLPSRRGGHRLVEQLHALGHPARRDVALAEQRERVELEVRVAEAARDGQRGDGALLTVGGACREHGAVENQPPVRRALVHALEQAPGALHPSAGDRVVAVVGAVEEREPASGVSGLDGVGGLAVRGERALLQLDRTVVLPQEVRGLAEAVERLGALGLAERLLEAGPCCLPVGGSQRLPALAQERVRVRDRHGDMISARSSSASARTAARGPPRSGGRRCARSRSTSTGRA